MEKNDLDRIKGKFELINSKAYWGDDYDVRYYLISKFQGIKNKKILDLGGGIGIISSELDKSNYCVNLDICFDDLKLCKNFLNNSIEVINNSMTNVSLKDNSFDYVICANLLEVAKTLDLDKKNNEMNEFPTVDKVLKEIKRILKPNGKLLLTTPNNEYYKSTKLSYDELTRHLKQHFTDFSLKLYNTYPKLHSKNRKLNMANIFPKIMGKVLNREKIIQEVLLKEYTGKNEYSVSFFVEAKKSE